MSEFHVSSLGNFHIHFYDMNTVSTILSCHVLLVFILRLCTYDCVCVVRKPRGFWSFLVQSSNRKNEQAFKPDQNVCNKPQLNYSQFCLLRFLCFLVDNRLVDFSTKVQMRVSSTSP